MQWSPKQEKALVEVDEWLKNGEEQVFRLFGYAGTGKTTLAKELASNAQGTVLFAAFTGKAAHVLQQKGCGEATTIHSLIYHTREKGQKLIKQLELELLTLKTELTQRGESIESSKRIEELNQLIKKESKNLSQLSFSLNTDSMVRRASLVVIDECSMVGKQMGEDLLSFGTKVLVLGDPAQLPPVASTGYFTENVKPDIMLDEIHRQAEDNPILKMATDVRLGKTLTLGQYGSSKVISVKDIKKEDILLCDQVLVGKNETRFQYNKRIRQLLGRKSNYPEIGDKLVCLRNEHDKGLLNGGMWEVTKVGEEDPERMIIAVKPMGGGVEIDVEVHSRHFFGNGKEIPWYERKEAQEFDYGYALTCHKAQGSQWDNVVVFDESASFRESKNRWLYTAITRAAEKVTIVKM